MGKTISEANQVGGTSWSGDSGGWLGGGDIAYEVVTGSGWGWG